MKQEHIDKRHGRVTLTIESLEDLWYLQQLIEPGNHVSGKTTRKIRIEGGSERTSAVTKKALHLAITVEKIQLTDTQLRLSGPLEQGTEEVSAGSYHTFALEPGMTFTLGKDQWLGFHWEKLEEACMPTHAPILLLVHDRETGIFALLKRTGVEVLTTLHGQVAKKGIEQQTKNFFKELAQQLQAYDERFHPESIILSSPSFFKEYVQHELAGQLEEKLITATVSTVGEPGIKELLRRDEIRSAIAKDRQVQERHYVEELFTRIGKGEPACYGMTECAQAAEAGAIETLLVSDKLLKRLHEEGKYEELDAILKAVDQRDGAIIIVSSEHEGGQKLDGLGGLGGTLRFAIT